MVASDITIFHEASLIRIRSLRVHAFLFWTFLEQHFFLFNRHFTAALNVSLFILTEYVLNCKQQDPTKTNLNQEQIKHKKEKKTHPTSKSNMSSENGQTQTWTHTRGVRGRQGIFIQEGNNQGRTGIDTEKGSQKTTDRDTEPRSLRGQCSVRQRFFPCSAVMWGVPRSHLMSSERLVSGREGGFKKECDYTIIPPPPP